MSAGALRILAVDDEPHALADVRRELERSPLVGEVDTATGAREALAKLRESRYDGLVLDERMPEIKGMALARLLRRVSDPPAVVFLSAHPSAAVEAFEVHAVDFLLKPVSAGRLRIALERVASTRRLTNGTERDETTDVIAVDAPGVKAKRLVRLATISVVRAGGDYAYVVCDDGEFVLRTPLSTLEVEWERAGFVRVHRGFLVNLRRATELTSEANGTANLELDTGTRIPVARRNVAALRRRLTV